HALVELRVDANSVGNGAEARPVSDGHGRLGAEPFAAATVVERAEAWVQRQAHRPPSRKMRSTPRSGKFGSFASWAISRRPMSSSPVSRPLVSSRPSRWNFVTGTKRPAGTACAAAYSGLRYTVCPKAT